MARSHTKSIIDAMITALRAIDGSGNDSFTPTIVQRHDEERSVEGPGWSIIVQLPRVRRTHNRETSDWQVTADVEIFVNVYTGIESELPTDEAIEEAQEDVFRALNSMDWESLRAEFADLQCITFREEDAEHPVAGFTATTAIEYSVSYTDPSVITDL